ncbi:MAG: cupin domain-containing protein [Euryarchaeota archaeon]|nr:cupin domain-containing protein [Euryarchaeota archaeon]
MPGKSSERIVNVNGGDWTGTDENGGHWKRLGQEAGSERLGCTLEAIAPGEQPAQYHYHLGNEEALYVLDGEGTLRTPDGEFEIESGDYVAFPAGTRGAHAVENTSEAVLRCLFVSTMNDPDLVVYPDDDELAVVAGAPSGSPDEEFTIAERFPFDGDRTTSDVGAGDGDES